MLTVPVMVPDRSTVTIREKPKVNGITESLILIIHLKRLPVPSTIPWVSYLGMVKATKGHIFQDVAPPDQVPLTLLLTTG